MRNEIEHTPKFDMVLFGGTGDLVMRKLLPSLYQAHAAGLLNEDGRILSLGRKEFSREDYLLDVEQHSRRHVKEAFSDELWKSFVARIDYLRLDASCAEDFPALAERLGDISGRSVVCYLATVPHLFAGICQHLAEVGLNRPEVRVVLEKPLGNDLESSNQINDAVAQYFQEQQLYRIDHYLGKESVQNLMAIRFGNALFEPLWRREWVHDVQITIAEELGVEGRGDFYDVTGALRDMVQNHLLQLLCIVAMEPPASLEADAVRDEKLKVLKALRRFDPQDVAAKTVRGQYKAGAIGGGAVDGFLSEAGIAPDSTTETFVAVKAEIDNWRWAGVPFFLRTGKRMAEGQRIISIAFREPPKSMFPAGSGISEHGPDHLTFDLADAAKMSLSFYGKRPGPGMRLDKLSMQFAMHDTGHIADVLEAYERLILDAMRGDSTLFTTADGIERLWEVSIPLLEAPPPVRFYAPECWGPNAIHQLVAPHAWRLPFERGWRNPNAVGS